MDESLLPNNNIDEVLSYLPEPVVKGIEGCAEAHGLSECQVVELALATFLNLDKTSFGAISNVLTPGEAQEKLAIVSMQLAAAQKALSEAGISESTYTP